MRHGESTNVLAGQLGALPGAALTRTGRDQAVAAAAKLAALGRRPTRVYASTAIRSIQTADVLVSQLRLTEPLTPLNGLVEVSLGRHEGTVDEPVHARSQQVLRNWVVHGGLDSRLDDGENGHEVVARVTSALRTIAADNPGGVVALVGHAASLTTGLAALCGIGPRVWGRPLPYAVPFLVRVDGDAWSCTDWPA